LAVVGEIAGRARMAKGNVKTPLLLVPKVADHLPFICCVCFEKERAKDGLALSWKLFFVCLLPSINWDLVSFQ